MGNCAHHPHSYSPAQLGWIAGIIEARGKIRKTSNPLRKSTQILLQVQTRHLDIAARLGKLTGVKVRYVESKRINKGDRKACAEHCPEAHVHVEPWIPAMGVWAVTGGAAAVVLHNVMPYLSSIEERQTIVDEIVGSLPTQGRGFHAVKTSVDRLRRLGWEIPPAMAFVAPDEPADEE